MLLMYLYEAPTCGKVYAALSTPIYSSTAVQPNFATAATDRVRNRVHNSWISSYSAYRTNSFYTALLVISYCSNALRIIPLMELSVLY